MTLLGLIVLLILIGVGLYLINNLIPMDAKIKTLINVVVIVIVVLWIAEALGLFSGQSLRLNRRLSSWAPSVVLAT